MNSIEEKEISCRVTNTIINFVKKERGDLRDILRGLNHTEEYLIDSNNWISQETFNLISDRVKRLFKDNEILFKIGLSIEALKTAGVIDYVTRLIGDPLYIVKKAPKYNIYFDKISQLTVLKSTSKSATIKIAPLTGQSISKDLCYFSAGVLAAIPKIRKFKLNKIIEEECCVLINNAGVIKGKFYKVDGLNYVWSYNEQDIKEEKGQIIGKLNPDGTFRVGETTFGAPACIYHLTWSRHYDLLERILFNIFRKPKLLAATIKELESVNEFLELKCDEFYKNLLDFQEAYVDAISAFIAAVDAKDPYTKDHSKNVAFYAVEMAKEIGLPASEIEDLRKACQLHDLGKVGVPHSIITKPGKLTDEEWKKIREHPALGAELIRPMAFLKNVIPMIRQDHERYDGKGYPDGLKGEEICIGARIIAVSDAYDTMISGRSYKLPFTREKAIEELKRCSGTQFDPKLVEVFLKILSRENSR